MNDSQLRDVLPLLRPRSAEMTPFMTTVWYLLWIGLALLIILYLYRRYRQRKERHAEFLAYCQDMGISDAQIRLLEHIARVQKLRHPERLLNSAHAFERQVGAYAQDLARRRPRSKQLRRIGRLREDLGFDRLPSDQALISTRQIDRGQTVLVSDIDEELQETLIPWLVLDRDEAAMQLSPLLREEPRHRHTPRAGEQLDVRFWREGDTEYHFEARVLSVDGENLTVSHSTRVERMQHRDFYRIHVDFPLDLYGIPDSAEDDAGDPETAETAALALLNGEEAGDDAGDGAAPTETRRREVRLHGRVENLSAGGFAMLIAAGDLPPGSLPDDEANQRWLWMADPAFEGDFPLAGLICRAVSAEPAKAQRRLKLQFEDLPSTVEKEIVKRVYQHQLETAGGSPSGTKATDDDETGEPEDEGADASESPDETPPAPAPQRPEAGTG